MRERIPRPKIEVREDDSDIVEWLDEESPEVRSRFSQLPRPLWRRHFEALERLSTDAPQDAAHAKRDYLSRVIEARKQGLEEFKASDEQFFEGITRQEIGESLSTLLESQENGLGEGTTARVKRLVLAGKRAAAVKYLLTPSEKTLSAEGEHDMLREVDTVTTIEEEEHKADAGERIRVPHPYFYYKNDKLQCYGMEEIEGRNIEQLTSVETAHTLAETQLTEEVRKAVQERYAKPEEQEALHAELDRFLNAVHAVCLHGDVKPANVMADRSGVIYLIDFGQSVRMDTMTDKTREQYENLQDDERKELAYCVRVLLKGIERREA